MSLLMQSLLATSVNFACFPMDFSQHRSFLNERSFYTTYYAQMQREKSVLPKMLTNINPPLQS